jgi:hypothetical protein
MSGADDDTYPMFAYRDKTSTWWYEAKGTGGTIVRVNLASRRRVPIENSSRWKHYEYVGIITEVNRIGYGVRDPVVMLCHSLLRGLLHAVLNHELPERNVVRFIVRQLRQSGKAVQELAKDFELNSLICRLVTMLECDETEEATSVKCSLLQLCVMLGI